MPPAAHRLSESNSRKPRTGRCLALAAAASITLPLAAPAQDLHPADRNIGNPPMAQLQELDAFGNPIETTTMLSLAGLPLPRVDSGVQALTFDIRETEAQIFNPRTNRYDAVQLRSYQTDSTDPSQPYVAPTVELTPGDTFRLTMINNLDADDPSCGDIKNVNIPHCFNSTNMHTHGLWVSPSGNSDNVLIAIRPGVTFQYEYNIPEDHPAGTFWYHPHLHGSTALQVGSGMAGALIIRDDRQPTPVSPGDIDILMQSAEGGRFAEQLVLFQQLPYACRENNDPAKPINKDPETGFWICKDGEIGKVVRYDQFGPGTWPPSGRYTSINGGVIPTFTGGDIPFRAGEVSRWRMIHAGVRDSIRPIFVKMTGDEDMASATAYTAGTDAEHEAFLDANCGEAPLEQFSMATDGLTRERLVGQDDAELHPGYREDLLMVFPEPGTYCLIDGDMPANKTISAETKSRKLLGYVVVEDGPGLGGETVQTVILNALVAAADVAIDDAGVRATVVSDLESGLGLGKFVRHASLMTTTPDGYQTLGFNIDINVRPPLFQIGTIDANGDLENPTSYDPEIVDRPLTLGDVEEWRLESFFDGHPFHIHVNPFQVVEVLDTAGVDVSGYEDDNNSPYARLRGAWKDTIFVTQDGNGGHYRINMRTKYERYIGEFVLHCHILDHEDKGMMENVAISLPGLAAHGNH